MITDIIITTTIIVMTTRTMITITRMITATTTTIPATHMDRRRISSPVPAAGSAA